MDAFTGSIVAYGFSYAPYQWQPCNGQILPISSNAALFSLLGTYYGGNGTSSFGLPNLQGCMAIGYGQGLGLTDYTLGETGVAEADTLTLSTMPMHTHYTAVTPPGGPISATLNGVTGAGLLTDPTGALIGASKTVPNSTFISPAGITPVAMASGAVSVLGGTVTGLPTVTLANNAGGSTPFPIHQPTLTINYSICMYGIFPVRS
jgi:microcystin-dependent protein